MPISAGTRLGPYEIITAIGAGGMGEVYRARDTRLGRDVAVKVLPQAFAKDPDRSARFEREAQAIATLSHPNILAIFDFGVHDGTAYTVTELLEGETLRERLRTGALALRKAVEIGVQLARGLAAAHDKGLVHRDLKPENVFILNDGQVKILDFGLARQTAWSPGSGAAETVAATDPGTVLGTVGYMAPEQVKGQPADARTDLFALGAVLYEMLSGRRAFQRDTAAETMTAILKDDPPELAQNRSDLPPALDRIVRHSLEKNPAERFQSARDVAFALDALSSSVVTSGAAARIPATRPARRWLAGAGLIVAGLAVGLVAGRQLFHAEATAPVFDAKTWEPQWITNARFAADGQTIAYSAALTGNTPRVFVIRPDSAVPQPVGPPETHLLAASSKGELAILTGARLLHHRIFSGTLARMTMDGAPRPWLEDVREADWSPDGSTLAIVHAVNGKDQLEYPIGTVLQRSNGYLSDPRVSPDGNAVAFFDHAIPADDRGQVKVVDRAGRVKTLSDEYSAMQGLSWTPDGRSLYYSAAVRQRDTQPFVVPASGSDHPRSAFSSPGQLLVFDFSKSGLALVSRTDYYRGIRGVAPGDPTEREFGWLSFSLGGVFSADGRLMSFTDLSPSSGDDYAVAVRHTDGSGVVRLGEGAAFGVSSDGKRVLAFIPSKQQIVIYPTGPGAPVTLERGPIASYNYTGQWFADDAHVLVCGIATTEAPRCYKQAVSGGPPQPITADGVDAAWAAPDGVTLLLHRTGGEYQVGAVGSPATRPAAGVTSADTPIAWSRDRRSVFVQAGLAVPARVEKVDTLTGARTFVRELAPADRSGLVIARVDHFAEEGQVYTYRYARLLSTMFVVSQSK